MSRNITREVRPLTRALQIAAVAAVVATSATALANTNTGNGIFRDEVPTNWCYSNSQPTTLLQTARSTLEWQGDGNLVIYDRADGAPRWATGTHHRGRTLCFWPDGNLGILDANGGWLWYTGSDGWAFKSHNGHYLRADGGGGGGLLADVRHNQRHERFHLIDAGEGAVALRTSNYHYVVAEGHGEANANRSAIGAWERFYLENNNDGTVSIKSAYWDRYLRAENAGGGNARFDVAHNQVHERYTMLLADKMVLEDCGLRIDNAEETLWQVSWSCGASTATVHGPTPAAQYWGNSNFGSGYTAQMGYQSPYAGYTRAFAAAAAYARVFGKQLTIIGADGEVATTNGTHASEANLEVLGVSLPVTVPGVGSMAELVTPISRTFFNKSQTFMAGPIPLTVTGTATGSLGLQGQIQPGATGVALTVRPYANLTGSAAVGIGVSCGILPGSISAGIRGNLTLVELGFPATVSLDVAARNVSLGATVDLTSLSGSLELYADVCNAWTPSWELCSWNGLVSSWALFPTQTFNF